MRNEAAEYDKHAIGAFKTHGVLVGHIPIELSSLIEYFLQKSEENSVSAVVVGSRSVKLALLYLLSMLLLQKLSWMAKFFLIGYQKRTINTHILNLSLKIKRL